MEEFNFDAFESYAKIVVIGVGGAGNNAVNRMIDEKIQNIDFWVCNTDAQALGTSKAEHKLVLGPRFTRGLGAGGNPEVGRKAAEDSLDDIKEIVSGADMVFIAAGMGGGTGTGAAPVIARAAKDANALTIAIVTRPFTMEGEARKVKAVEGIEDLKQNVDSMIIVSNDKLMMMKGGVNYGIGFEAADNVLAQTVKTITDLITIPGKINLDYNDVKNLLKDTGLALIGYGSGSGDKKAIEAATDAISSPLLEASINGARKAIINITCGQDVTMFDIQDAVQYITEATGSNLNITLGVQQNSEINDTMLVSIIATDFVEEYKDLDVPTMTQFKPIVNEVENSEDNEESILPIFIKEN